MLLKLKTDGFKKRDRLFIQEKDAINFEVEIASNGVDLFLKKIIHR